MGNSRTAGFRYLMTLARAGVEGAAVVGRAAGTPRVGVTSIITPAAIGGLLGASSISLRGRRPGRSVALAGLTGAAIGIGCGLAWSTRRFTRGVARGAAHRINAVRDAYWLETHPIDYA